MQARGGRRRQTHAGGARTSGRRRQRRQEEADACKQDGGRRQTHASKRRETHASKMEGEAKGGRLSRLSAASLRAQRGPSPVSAFFFYLQGPDRRRLGIRREPVGGGKRMDLSLESALGNAMESALGNAMDLSPESD